MNGDIEIPTPQPKATQNLASAAWTTTDELYWLRHIGQQWRTTAVDDNPSPAEIERRRGLDRIALLQRHRESISKRSRWEKIDRFAVMKFLHDFLGDTP